MKFYTPNVVVVFSNEKPDIKEAVKDRWRILQIKEDDLIDLSKRYKLGLSWAKLSLATSYTQVWFGI